MSAAAVHVCPAEGACLCSHHTTSCAYVSKQACVHAVAFAGPPTQRLHHSLKVMHQHTGF